MCLDRAERDSRQVRGMLASGVTDCCCTHCGLWSVVWVLPFRAARRTSCNVQQSVQQGWCGCCEDNDHVVLSIALRAWEATGMHLCACGSYAPCREAIVSVRFPPGTRTAAGVRIQLESLCDMLVLKHELTHMRLVLDVPPSA